MSEFLSRFWLEYSDFLVTTGLVIIYAFLIMGIYTIQEKGEEYVTRTSRDETPKNDSQRSFLLPSRRVREYL